jgi:hypothetical protein
MPPSRLALMEPVKKCAATLEVKGKPVDFKDLLRMEPEQGVFLNPPKIAKFCPAPLAQVSI